MYIHSYWFRNNPERKCTKMPMVQPLGRKELIFFFFWCVCGWGGGCIHLYIKVVHFSIFLIYNNEKIEKMCEEIETNLLSNLNEMVREIG